MAVLARKEGRGDLHYAWVVTTLTALVLLTSAGIRALAGLLLKPLEVARRLHVGVFGGGSIGLPRVGVLAGRAPRAASTTRNRVGQIANWSYITFDGCALDANSTTRYRVEQIANWSHIILIGLSNDDPHRKTASARHSSQVANIGRGLLGLDDVDD